MAGWAEAADAKEDKLHGLDKTDEEMPPWVETNLGRKPEQVSADASYCSAANLEALEARGIDAYVATGRARDAVAGTDVTAAAEAVRGALEAAAATASPDEAEPPTRVETMRAKIKSGGHDSPYRFRKQLPEPVFGQIKEARGFRQFLLRGIEKVRAEWAIICSTHNLRKLAEERRLSAAMLPTLA